MKFSILACDVWEHAYCIDCRNTRPKCIENFWNPVNWHFLSESDKQKCHVSKSC
ncbi:MAG: hypothetical protein PF439_01615 [Helicobacteraceae bacterium]|nr:hypothetical protein [Helicobacteraceae bacterium]